MASFSPAPIATEPTPKDMLKPLLVRAKPNFSAIPLETAPQEVKAGWALRVSGILGEVDEVMMALQGKPGLGKAKAQVETWKTTLHDFKLSNGLAEEDVEDLFWSDEDDDMGDIPSEPAVPARVEDSFPDNLGAGVQASSIPGLSTLHQAISDPDSDNFLPSSRDVHDAGPTAPHETISDSAGDHVHVTQSSSRDAHDAGATTLSQTISDSDRTDTDTTLRPSHDAQVTFEEGQNPPSPRAERDETASEDDESETSRSESSEPEVSSRKRPREDDADDAPADLPTTSSGKVQPQVFIARADHSRPTPTPPITVQGPKAKRLKSDTPVIKEDTGNGTVETGDDGSADWTYRDKEGKLVTKHYDPVRGESCRRCTMQRLNCLVILSEKTTSIACMACTRGKSGCSFVTDRKEAKGLASGKSTGNVHAAKKTNAKKTEVTRIKMEKHGSTQKAMTKASSSGLRQPETRSSSVGSGNDSVVAEKSLGLGPKVDMLNRKEIAAKKALEEASSALRAAVQDVAEKEGEYLQASEDAKQAMVDYGKWQKRRKL